MEEQGSSTQSFSIAPLWLKVLLAGTFVSLGVLELLKHGFRSEQWFWAFLLLSAVFPESIKGALDRNTHWAHRILNVLGIGWLCAWFVHFSGWVPALAFAGMALVTPRQQEKWLGWKMFFAKPQSIILAISVLTLVIWFAWDTGGWVPAFCVVTTFLLLEGYTGARREFVNNLKRRPFLGVLGVGTIAGIWASLHPSFGNIAGFVAVIVLASSDVYLHTEDRRSAHP